MIYSDDFSKEAAVEIAVDHFEGHGCAESVLLAVSKATGQDCAYVPHIATGLQGGLVVGEVCGAVSGG